MRSMSIVSGYQKSRAPRHAIDLIGEFRAEPLRSAPCKAARAWASPRFDPLAAARRIGGRPQIHPAVRAPSSLLCEPRDSNLRPAQIPRKLPSALTPPLGRQAWALLP